jgi:hypothetical protein
VRGEKVVIPRKIRGEVPYHLTRTRTMSYDLALRSFRPHGSPACGWTCERRVVRPSCCSLWCLARCELIEYTSWHALRITV